MTNELEPPTADELIPHELEAMREIATLLMQHVHADTASRALNELRATMLRRIGGSDKRAMQGVALAFRHVGH